VYEKSALSSRFGHTFRNLTNIPRIVPEFLDKTKFQFSNFHKKGLAAVLAASPFLWVSLI
jgi:hypothetical protein